MALGFLYTCSCGKRFKVYVPKQKLFRTITGGTVNWERIDELDEANGSVDEVKRQAERTESAFIDVRGGERLRCSACQSEVNLMSHFRTVMMRLSHPRTAVRR